nr:porin [uncultured Roseateles sp.]
MNKFLVASAALAACVGSASAQSNGTSSVTVAGLINVAMVRNNSATGPNWKVDRGDNNRLIFRGVEDLGNGLSATFALQHRFEPDTGTQESGVRPFWQGESRVGLRSTTWGWLRLGRGLTPVQDPNGRYETFGVATVANTQDQLTAYYKAVDNITQPLNAVGVSPAEPGGEGRWDNAAFYESPNINGWVARVAVQAEHSQITRPFSASVTYDQGPISAMLGYERNNRNTVNIQAAGWYDFGVAKLIGSYAINDPEGALKLVGVGIGAHVPLVGPLTLRMAYAQTTSNAASAFTSKKTGVGLKYDLSKRTFVYTDVARSNPLTSGVSVTAGDLGIAHTF